MKIKKIGLLILTLILFSCEEKSEPVLEVDDVVLKVHYYYNFDIENSDIITVKQRNLVKILLNKKGECLIEGKMVEDSLIVSELKKYLVPNPDNDDMPETVERDFEFSGKVLMNKNVMISGRFDDKLYLKRYVNIRDKIYTAYSEVRNSFAKEKFNKTLTELMDSGEEDDRLIVEEIKEIFPFRYVESKLSL
ncbi:MAG: hypothetical protein AB8B65_09890 [Kordia sp.]|uniref:hypothetical protein n=1 Tax=Kordia sp. TaxID=1965332 RepID=UPI00385AD81A